MNVRRSVADQQNALKELMVEFFEEDCTIEVTVPDDLSAIFRLKNTFPEKNLEFYVAIDAVDLEDIQMTAADFGLLRRRGVGGSENLSSVKFFLRKKAETL
ncbi:hypothetical protein ACP275_09G132100 [Erythranthe tilingii]